MSAQAQAENDRFHPIEDEMTESEQMEYEKWLDGVYWGMRLSEIERGEEF